MKILEDHLEKTPFVSLFFKFSIPAAISLIIITLFSLIETAIVGRFCSAQGLSLVAFYFPYQSLVMAVSSALGVGGASLISRKLGEKDGLEASRTAGFVFMLAIFVGVIFSVFSFCFPGLILTLSGWKQSSTVTSLEAVSFIRISGLSLLFFPATIVVVNFMRAEGTPWRVVHLMGLGLFLNLIILFSQVVLGNGGLKGVAYASLLGRATSFLLALGYFRITTKRLPISRGFFVGGKNRFISVIKIGFSAFTMGFSTMVISLFLNWLIRVNSGNEAVAMLAVIYRWQTLLLLPTWAIIQGVQPILGYYHGAKRFREIPLLLIFSSIISFLFTFLLSLPGFLKSQELLSLFSSNLYLIKQAPHVIPWIMGSGLVLSLYHLFFGFYQATGRAAPAFIFSLVRQIFLFIPIAVIFVFIAGIESIWPAFFIGDLIALVGSFVYLFKNSFKAKNIGSPKGSNGF